MSVLLYSTYQIRAAAIQTDFRHLVLCDASANCQSFGEFLTDICSTTAPSLLRSSPNGGLS